MHRIWTAILLASALSACQPSSEQVARQNAATASSQAAQWTSTPRPSATATPTSTPSPTPTPSPTATPTPVGGPPGLIAYVNQAPSSQALVGDLYNILTVRLDGSDPTNITHNSDPTIQLFHPQWSPDGERIAFTRSDNQSNSQIYVMNADGTSVQKLSPVPQYAGTFDVESVLVDTQPVWSPDGKTMAFASNRHSLQAFNPDLEIYTINLQTYELTQVTRVPGSSEHPTWSPDGETIAFMSDRDGDWEINAVSADGSKLAQLTRNRASDRFPSWSPDGSQIAFHSDRDGNIEIYIINLQDSSETRITTNPAADFTVSWSPDSEWISFLSDRDGDDELYIMKLDGSQLTQLTNNSDDDAVASWSP